MFLLSIIPLPISKDSDGIASNNTISELATAEQAVKNLEATYSMLLIGIVSDSSLYYSMLLNGGNNNSAYVKTQLDAARAHVQELIEQGQAGTEEGSDVSSRLTEVQRLLPAADQRIKDLTALKNALANHTILTDSRGYRMIISGVDNTNPYAVQKALDQALAYKSELETMASFWKTVVQSRNEALDEKDLNDDGKIDEKELEIYEASHTQLQSLSDLRMQTDLEIQRNTSEAKIVNLNMQIASLTQMLSQVGDSSQRKTNVAQLNDYKNDLERETIHLNMLNGLLE